LAINPNLLSVRLTISLIKDKKNSKRVKSPFRKEICLSEINFNIKYLIDFLKVVDSELVIFLIHHKESPAIIKPESGAEHIYVIMPLKAS
jgi:DNA polymerase III sliding clamp (beta) subunit (PCNA family)